MKVTDVFEKLNPRVIWTEDKWKRPVVNGFFYDSTEIHLMDVLLTNIGVSPKWYKRRSRHEWILQISGEDVETFLRFYTFKDQRKRLRQKRILRDKEYGAYTGNRS